MKNALLPLLLLGAALSGLRAEDKPEPGGGRPDRPGSDRPGRSFGPPGEGWDRDRPMHRWLESRRAQNPEEFDRLRRMHEENPEEFRRMLGQRLAQERLRRVAPRHPEVMSALENLPEEKRRAFFQDLLEMPSGPDGGYRPDRGGPDHGASGGPDKKASFAEVHALVQRHREATEPAERERLARELRARVGEVYRRRVQEREEQIARMEQEILKARREVEEQARGSEQAIDGRVRDLLGAP